MRYPRPTLPGTASLLPLLLTLIVFLACQDVPSPPEMPSPEALAQEQADQARSRMSSSEGGRLVLRAIEAHGGLEAWYGAPTSAYTWEYSNIGSNMRFKSYLVADNQTRLVYHDLLELGTPDNPQPVSGRLAWDGNDAWISPDTLSNPNPRFWTTTGYYFESIPFVLADPGLHYEILPVEDLDGVPHDMVRVSYDAGVGDSPGDTYTLYVHQETGRVNAIRYTVTYGRPAQTSDATPRRAPRENLFYYEDYVTVDGLTVATRFRGFRFTNGQKGDFRNEAWAGDISFRQPFDASKLVMPPNARIQPLPDAARSSN